MTEPYMEPLAKYQEGHLMQLERVRMDFLEEVVFVPNMISRR